MQRALVAGLVLFACGSACSVDADRAAKDLPKAAGAFPWVPTEGPVERTLTPPPLADRVVAFPADRVSELLKQCSRQVSGPLEGTWLPDHAVLGLLDDALGPAFKVAIAKAGARVPKQHALDDYYRQYAGVIVGGRRIVYINAFHGLILEWARVMQRPVDWRDTPIAACDGGTMFFGAEFDVQSDKITALEFNGPG